jgi:hypothetical protein
MRRHANFDINRLVSGFIYGIKTMSCNTRG